MDRLTAEDRLILWPDDAGQFDLMAVGDADAYPDIEVFVAAAHDELRTLGASTTPSEAASTEAS